MPNTNVPAAGEAMPKTQELLDQFEEFMLAVSIVKMVWLAMDSPNYSDGDDLTDVQNTLYEAYHRLQHTEKAFRAANNEASAAECAKAREARR